ncbi:MAG: hypothetical protein INR73_17945 [Williamsia sp.]|nr:hypothetical protein [Williamsia sp.]
MPEFNDYDKEGKPISTRIEILSAQNQERYRAEYGDERAKGYTDALKDFLTEVELILFKPRKPGQSPYTANSDYAVRRDLKKYRDEKSVLFDTLKSQLHDQQAQNKSELNNPQQT